MFNKAIFKNKNRLEEIVAPRGYELVMLNAKELVERIAKAEQHADVVVMHDFFVDHIVSFERSFESVIDEITSLSRQGGGHTIARQQLLGGGKAVNTCSALASLGVKTHYIGKTDAFGLYLLDFFLGRKGVDISHVKAGGRLGLTTALEMPYKGRLVNVMCNDSASNVDFDFLDLDDSDLDLIRKTDCLLLADWSLNLKGSELAEGVFDFARKESSCLIFFDPGDPSWRKQDIPSLMEKVILKGNLDVLSVNESEAFWLAACLRNKTMNALGDSAPRTGGIDWGRVLSQHLNCRIDLHTPLFAATFEKGKEYIAPTYDVPVYRTTGAGDCWNAGDLYGVLIGLSHTNRLLLANAVAAYYISHSKGDHATKEGLIEFIKAHSTRKLKESWEP